MYFNILVTSAVVLKHTEPDLDTTATYMESPEISCREKEIDTYQSDRTFEKETNVSKVRQLVLTISLPLHFFSKHLLIFQ
jgi:hypothetical protein